MKARAPSAMCAPCWLKSSKKFPSRGSSLPNSMFFLSPGTRGVYERSQTGPGCGRRFRDNRGLTPTRLRRHPMDERQRASGHATSGAAIVVRELQCRRGDRVLFAPTNFVVAPGTIVWLRGANGQGKTTLLRTLAGLSAPAAGEIV